MSDTIDNRKCERCGADFRCGAEDGHCWCFELAVEPEARLEIGKLFTDCLCSDCLKTFSAKNQKAQEA